MELEKRPESAVTEHPERRAHPRQLVDEDAALLLLKDGARVVGRVIEISLDGCRVRMRDRFLAGSLVRVEISFKINGIAFRFGGVIEWTDGRDVMGIRFVGVASRRLEQWIEVFCEVEAENAAKAARRAEETLKSEALAAEKPVREPGGSQVPTFPQQPPKALAAQPFLTPQPSAPTTTGLPPAVPTKRERRKQSRHEVDTSAVVFLINVGSKICGRILDLSLSGCRIRSDERFPVGIYTRVETEFRIEGLPFRLGGVVQSIHDRHNVGIRFLDMSVRKREQVEQLIGEIEEMRERRKPALLADSGEATVGGHGG